MRSFSNLCASLIVFMLFFSVFSLGAQDQDDDDEIATIETNWARLNTQYNRGDQLFGINIGLVHPLLFAEQTTGIQPNNINMGGNISLHWNYFLGPRLNWGVELCFMFASTLGENMYFAVPFGARIGYQFLLGRFEIPLSFMAGFAPQSENQLSYFGLFAKPGAAVFFRFNNNFSFGANAHFWWVPQWTRKTQVVDSRTRNINIHGFFLETSIGLRYHF